MGRYVSDRRGTNLATARPLRFGELLQRSRLAAHLTPEALAERARLSVKGIGALEGSPAHATPVRAAEQAVSTARSTGTPP